MVNERNRIMTSKQKITEIRRLLSIDKMASILEVSTNTVKSWTKSQKGARAPGKKNSSKIDDLYDSLRSCFDRIEKLSPKKEWPTSKDDRVRDAHK